MNHDKQAAPEVVKHRCSCGKAYTAKAWEALPNLGTVAYPGYGITLEYRNCSCGSTCTIEVIEGARPLYVSSAMMRD
jgi:hypothetical protein